MSALRRSLVTSARRAVAVATLALGAGPLASCASDPLRVTPAELPDPPQVQLGERLFLEPRFAATFAAQSGGDVNRAGIVDPVVAELETTGAARPGPFAGSTMSCRGCHLVDDSPDPDGRGTRTYADFARRSPIPARAEDARTHAPRNSPSLVDATAEREVPFLLHADGEFATAAALVEGTWTGRNLGWLADEHDRAVAHIASVVRGDDGGGVLAASFGGLSYATLLEGDDPAIPPALRLPPERRIAVASASDAEVVDAAVALVVDYLDGLRFSRDLVTGDFDGSPYDRFVALNRLPPRPAAGEGALDYARRLRTAIAALRSPVWVRDGVDGELALHDHPFRFGPDELDGLLVFLSEADAPATSPSVRLAARERGTGNCLTCHAPPQFSDFALHDVGVAQEGFDAVHGDGAFARLAIPALAERNADPERWLPPSRLHPRAHGPFLAIPRTEDPMATDLGAWNVLGNPAVPAPQSALATLVARAAGLDDGSGSVRDDELLARSVALFKTPVLRDLGQSSPYFHDGSRDTTAQVVQHYRRFSELARAGEVRNGAPELAAMRLGDGDVAPLVAFLESLDEDYD